MSEDDRRFPFREEVRNRFCKWLGITRDEEIDEALEDLTGDTYFEMRKLISQLLTEVEQLIIIGKYRGFVQGKELTTEQKEGIKEVREDLKEFVRKATEATWRSILKKQKIGIDKLSLSLKPYMKVDEIDLESGDK